MILRRENDLAVLRIRLDRRGRTLPDGQLGSAVLFELVVGSGDAVELARVAPTELGLPADGLTGAQQNLAITLPDLLLVHPAFGAALAGRTALWLELPAPSGPLRPLDWERALAPLGVPVLRLPYFLLRPKPTMGPRVLVVCASAPLAKGGFDVADGVRRIAAVARDRLGSDVRVHVFTDQIWFPALTGSADLTVHDPAPAAEYPPPPPDVLIGTPEADGTLRNPWLRWMRRELRGVAVDHVHFLCHGYLAADGGAVALAPTPLDNDDERISRFVGAVETANLLAAVGAWSVGFTGPTGNYSELGLRALADAIAAARPGPVLAHESRSDRDYTQLGAALALALGPDRAADPEPSQAARWIHPQRVQLVDFPTTAAPIEALLDGDSSTLLFGSATTAALAAPDTPNWVASSARVLEQAQAAWLSPTQNGHPSAPDEAWLEQARTALREACDLLEAHVLAAGGTP